MGKRVTVSVRVDEETKREAERILRELGIPLSSAVAIFLKAVVRNGGFPFELRLEGQPSSYPYEGIVRIRERELSESSLEALKEVERGEVEPYV